jgi:hypothetical protein
MNSSSEASSETPEAEVCVFRKLHLSRLARNRSIAGVETERYPEITWEGGNIPSVIGSSRSSCPKKEIEKEITRGKATLDPLLGCIFCTAEAR